MTEGPVVLVTGAARRIGRAIACGMHEAGYRVAVHFHQSREEADRLVSEFIARRPDSAFAIGADLSYTPKLAGLVESVADHWGRLDVLVNNASRFFPTRSGVVSEEQWKVLMDANLKAPYFLCQAAFPYLAEKDGCIVNLTDVYAQRGLADHTVYCMSKAGLVSMTHLLAKEFAPRVRVNAVAPGAILWPENDEGTERQAEIVRQIPMQRAGDVQDVVSAVLYLTDHAPYVTGQQLVVDGGRSVNGL